MDSVILKNIDSLKGLILSSENFNFNQCNKYFDIFDPHSLN